MSNLYNVLSTLCAHRKITAYKMCKDLGLQPSIMTDLKMGRRSGVNAKTADKLATYFGVTVSYLLGNEQKDPIQTDEVKLKSNKVGVNEVIFSRNGETIHRTLAADQMQAIRTILDSLPEVENPDL